MNISINPWYYCNFRCDFCYLDHHQLSDKKLLDLDKLNEKLSELFTYETIDQIDFYGVDYLWIDKSNYVYPRSEIYSNIDIYKDVKLEKVFESSDHTSTLYKIIR